MSTSKLDDWSSFFFTTLPGGEAKRGLERRPNSFGRVAVKTSSTSTS